jgi:glutathione S-transferase
MIKLYDHLSCPYGQKVRIALGEKGLNYDLVTVDFTRGDNRKPEFLGLNPFGRVPVLVDEDTTVYDSTVINEYLDDEYPEPPIMPALGASGRRARARSFEDFADTSFTPVVGQLIAEFVKPDAERDQARVGRFHQQIERVLDYVNHQLGANQFIATDFSTADIAFAPRLIVLGQLGIEVGSNNRSNVAGWTNRLLERASIAALADIAVEALPGG